MKHHVKQNKVSSPGKWIAFLCLLFFVSCTGDEVLTYAPLEVVAEIGGVQSRATEVKDETDYEKKDRFEYGDEIKIRKTGESETGTYRKNNSGGWQPSDSGNTLLTSGNEEFVATYPTDFTSILSDQTTYTNYWLSNCLTATARATDNRVSFSFAPAAAKITIIIVYEVDNVAMSAEVTGANVCTEPGKTENVQLLCTSKEARRHTYTGILSPAATSTYKISVVTTVGGTSQTSAYTEKGGFTLAAGCEYQYTFTKTSELILSSVVVKEFQSTPESDAGTAT